MKFILAMFVVAAHTGFGKDVSFEFRYLFYNGLVRVAVPAFFVINGFFFYKNIIVGGTKFETWRNRLAVLYLIWTIIYLPIYWPESAKLNVALIELVSVLLFGWLHLWYLVSTLGAGILIYKFLRNKSSIFMIALCSAVYAFGLSLQYLGNYHLIADPRLYAILEDTAVYRNFLFFGLPFMTLGFLIAKHDVLSRVRANATLLVCAALSVALVIAEAAFNLRFLASNKGFDLMFTIPLAGPALFLAAQKFHKPARSRLIADLSTGVFLIHPLFLFGLLALHLYSTTLLTVATIALATGASWMLLQFETTRRWLF